MMNGALVKEVYNNKTEMEMSWTLESPQVFRDFQGNLSESEK
jgi:hypothetical protein